MTATATLTNIDLASNAAFITISHGLRSLLESEPDASRRESLERLILVADTADNDINVLIETALEAAHV